MMETLIFMWCPAQLVLVGWVMGQGSGIRRDCSTKGLVASEGVLMLSPCVSCSSRHSSPVRSDSSRSCSTPEGLPTPVLRGTLLAAAIVSQMPQDSSSTATSGGQRCPMLQVAEGRKKQGRGHNIVGQQVHRPVMEHQLGILWWTVLCLVGGGRCHTEVLS